MRIITESNIDQLVSMSYSDNINKLLGGGEGDTNLDSLFKKFKDNLIKTIALENDKKVSKIVKKKAETALATPDDKTISVEYAPNSPAYIPNVSDTSSRYDPNSPQYDPNSPQYDPNSPQYDPNSPQYVPNSPQFSPSSPDGPPPPRFQPTSPDDSPPPIRLETNPLSQDLIPNIKNPKLKSQFEELNERDKKLLLQMMEKNKQKKNEKINEIMKKDKMDILETDENKLKLEELVDNPQEDKESTSISTVEPLSSSSTSTDETKSVKFTV